MGDEFNNLNNGQFDYNNLNNGQFDCNNLYNGQFDCNDLYNGQFDLNDVIYGPFVYNNLNNGMFDYEQFNYNEFAASGFNYNLYGFSTNDYIEFVNQYGMLYTIDEYMYHGIPPMYLPLFFAMLADRQREVVPRTPEQEDKLAFGCLMFAVVVGMIGFVIYMFFLNN